MQLVTQGVYTMSVKGLQIDMGGRRRIGHLFHA